MGTRRLDLKEAATELGITSEAVRRRAKRGTLDSETGEDGRLYVWLPDVSDNGPHGGPHGGSPTRDAQQLPEALLERYEDENDFLRRELERLHRELERKDAILLTMAQRIPELEPAKEASSDERESPPHVSEEEAGAQTPPEQDKRSWWRRIFS